MPYSSGGTDSSYVSGTYFFLYLYFLYLVPLYIIYLYLSYLYFCTSVPVPLYLYLCTCTSVPVPLYLAGTVLTLVPLFICCRYLFSYAASTTGISPPTLLVPLVPLLLHYWYSWYRLVPLLYLLYLSSLLPMRSAPFGTLAFPSLAVCTVYSRYSPAYFWETHDEPQLTRPLPTNGPIFLWINGL